MYRSYRPFVADAVQLFAQTLDMDVHRAGVAEVIKAPYLVEKLISCKNMVGM